jgi:F-type H+-transporting ATPase subunit b
MRVHQPAAPTRRSPLARSRAGVWPFIAVLFAVLLVVAGSSAAQPHDAQPQQPAHAAPQQPAHGTPAAGEHAAESGEEHGGGWLQTVARLFNFALLAGVLAYYLKAPIAGYISSRSSQIRQDLVTAAELRASATAQLAEIERQLKSLPAELEALKKQGVEDVRAEKLRIAQAAAVERERLLEHARREIDMRLRIAKRELVEHAANLAVEVARARITSTITPDDQLKLVDRYTAQLRGAS